MASVKENVKSIIDRLAALNGTTPIYMNSINENLAAIIDQLDGLSGSVNDAADITSGTLADARLSSNVAMRNAANTFTAAQTINQSGDALKIVGAGNKYVLLSFSGGPTEINGIRFGDAYNAAQCQAGQNLQLRAFYGIDLVVDSLGGFGGDVRIIRGSTIVCRITKDGVIFAPGLRTAPASPASGEIYADSNGFLKRG